jgi:hypothetical protein
MPYVQPEAPPTLPTPFPIGGQNGISNGQAIIEEASQQVIQQEGGKSSLLYLWLGFLGTLLIFIASVVGATMLFTRRNES